MIAAIKEAMAAYMRNTGCANDYDMEQERNRTNRDQRERVRRMGEAKLARDAEFHAERVRRMESRKR